MSKWDWLDTSVGCFKHKLAAIFTQSSFQTQQNIQFLLDSRSVPAYFTHQSNDADIKLFFFCSYVLFRADGEKLAVVGSPFWMAPEVLRDEPYNEKVKSLLVQRRFADSDQFKSQNLIFASKLCKCTTVMTSQLQAERNIHSSWA